MKRFLTALALLTLPATGFAQVTTEEMLSAPAINAMPRGEITIKDSNGLAHVIHVEVAQNVEDQARGLMGRQKLERDAGMLFFFGAEQPRFFWMKDTLIPLDMLFIRSDGTISHIHPNAKPHDESVIPSKGPVVAVLELNGGAAAGLGIKEGDQVFDSHYFKNQPVP